MELGFAQPDSALIYRSGSRCCTMLRVAQWALYFVAALACGSMDASYRLPRHSLSRSYSLPLFL